MLDALKGLGGSGKAQKQSDDLQSLISTAKEERSALSAMLTQISMRTAKVTQMAKTLEQVDEKASAAKPTCRRKSGSDSRTDSSSSTTDTRGVGSIMVSSLEGPRPGSPLQRGEWKTRTWRQVRRRSARPTAAPGVSR